MIKSISFAIINAFLGMFWKVKKKERNDGQNYIKRMMITKG